MPEVFSLDKLGPLPDTHYLLAREDDGYGTDLIWEKAAYTADQMRAYAAAEAAKERERCALLCEEISEKYQSDEGLKYPELKTDAEEGASKCARAIRSQHD